MNSLNIELTNCFGIDSLIHEFTNLYWTWILLSYIDYTRQ